MLEGAAGLLWARARSLALRETVVPLASVMTSKYGGASPLGSVSLFAFSDVVFGFMFVLITEGTADERSLPCRSSADRLSSP